MKLKLCKRIRRIICKAFSSARRRAKEKGFRFEITRKDLVVLLYRQRGLCFYTDKPLATRGSRVMSLDRVDNDRGYFIGNVVWCHLEINQMKSSRKYEDVRDICIKILDHTPDKRLLDKEHLECQDLT